MKSSFYQQNALIIFALFLFTTPWVITSARLAVEQSSNRVADWLPESFGATQRLKWFQKHFASDDLLMISWDGCDFDDPRLPMLAEKLREPVDIGDKRRVAWSRQVITGPEVLHQLRSEPLQLSRKESLLNLRGWLSGDDLKTTCLIVLLTKEGWDNRHFLVEHIRTSAGQVEGLASGSLHMAGSTLDSIAIDQPKELAMDDDELLWRRLFVDVVVVPKPAPYGDGVLFSSLLPAVEFVLGSLDRRLATVAAKKVRWQMGSMRGYVRLRGKGEWSPS